MSDSPSDISATFIIRWVMAFERLQMNPLHPMRVAFSESGIRATAHNPGGDASGVIQFMPATLKLMGFRPDLSLPAPEGETKDERKKRLRAEDFARAAAFRAEVSLENQVPYAERFFRGNAPYLKTDALCYVATFVPATLRYITSPATVIAAVDEELLQHYPEILRPELVKAYRWNLGFDKPRPGETERKGYIAVADLGEHLARVCRGARYEAIAHRIEVAMGHPSPPPPPPPSTDPALPATESDGGQARYDATSEAVVDAALDEIAKRSKRSGDG